MKLLLDYSDGIPQLTFDDLFKTLNGKIIKTDFSNKKLNEGGNLKNKTKYNKGKEE